MTHFVNLEDEHLLDASSLPEFNAHEEGIPSIAPHAYRGIFSQSPDRAAQWMETVSECYWEN